MLPFQVTPWTNDTYPLVVQWDMCDTDTVVSEATVDAEQSGAGKKGALIPSKVRPSKIQNTELEEYSPSNRSSSVCVFSVCFLPIHSGHQVRWTYQPGSHRRKVTQDFSSTFFLRCVP